MKSKRFLTPILAIATGCVCLFTTACADLDGLLGGGGDHGDEHTGWAYVTTDDTYHWQYATCHPNVTTEKEEHDYTDDNDATCNTCGHGRHVHSGWAYVDTDPDNHWESPSCHPDVKRNVEPHDYDGENDTTCDTCGHLRSVDGSGHVHTGWAYVKTDGTKHWESPSCHPDVKRNEGPHVYTNDDDADCNTCGYTRTIAPPSVAGEISYAHAGYESAAFEWGDSNAKSATVKYKLSSSSSYTSVDNDLIRQKNSSTARVDVLGLKKNSLYDFQITTSTKQVLNVTNVLVDEYDRSGYAHFNYTEGVGAYNDDGTLKNNAVVVYVNESNKNTVKATIDGKTYTGIVEILKNAGTKTPLVVRILGTVGAATWKQLIENNDKALTPDQVLGMDGKTKLVDKYNIKRSTYNENTKKYEGGESKDIYQATLIADGINELDTKNGTLLELIGLNSKIKYDNSKDEFDSCWNDCNIQNVKNVTIEGVGEDAKIFQWGFTFKNSSSIEVRNLTFDDYTEDACSFEASETSATSLSGFKSGNIWVHNNVFEEGVNYWDVCNEQDKHDGDGSTDFKGLKDITISYNVYHETHKTGLIGGGNGHTTANVTFHHNWYNGCKARLPLARQANMHMYNNYYNGTTDTSISLRANAYAFVENCYFDSSSSNTKVIELQDNGSDGKGSAKVINSTIASGKISNSAGDDYYYFGTSRTATVTSGNKFAPNFDTNSSLFYYKNGKSDVKEMLTAEQVKTTIPLVAGVLKRSNNLTGGSTTDPDNPTGQTIIYIPETDGLNGTTDGVVTVTSTDTNGTQYKNGSPEVNIGGTKISANKALKIDTKVTITITVTQETILTIYMYVDNIKVDGTTQTCETDNSKGYYEMTITLSAGTHTLTRGSAENYLYMLKLTAK